MINPSVHEQTFMRLWDELYPELTYVREYSKVIPMRKFRFDFAWVDSLVVVEINGQIWHKGGHSSGSGLSRDYEKLNLAQANNWSFFVLSKTMITPQWLYIISERIRSRLPY